MHDHQTRGMFLSYAYNNIRWSDSSACYLEAMNDEAAALAATHSTLRMNKVGPPALGTNLRNLQLRVLGAGSPKNRKQGRARRECSYLRSGALSRSSLLAASPTAVAV